jgi:hypothetical protein
MAISVTGPIGQAWNRAMLMTFKPFNLGKWFVLGFVAWLATIGEPRGCSSSGPGGGGGGGPGPVRLPTSAPSSMPGSWQQSSGGSSSAVPQDVWNWVTSHLPVILLVAAGIVLAFIVIWLLLVWISSRGKFMFIHAIATNTVEVVAPWKYYRAQGDSLFLFRAYLSIAYFIALFVSAAGATLLAWSDIKARTFGAHSVSGIIFALALLVPASLILGLIHWCTTTLVAPIMYVSGGSVYDAWWEFRQSVMPGNVGKLILLLLMQIVLGIAMAVAQFVLGCATCCIGWLPYVNTVLTLPLVVFMQCYSICFLQQFGPRYAIIQGTPAAGFPVIGVPNPPQ